MRYEPVPDSAPIAQAVLAELPGAQLGIADATQPNAKRLWVVHAGRSAEVSVPVVALETPQGCERLLPLIVNTLDRAGQPR